MRIDNAQFTGSATGTQATATLTGSFTGSGHIDRANTASKIEFSASFGLGIENTFVYDGSSNQSISIDTASVHFIEGVHSASIDAAETGSFLITSSISASGELLMTKGDGTVYSESIVANSTRASLNSGLGTSFSSYNGSITRAVNVNTSSAHFVQGVSAQTGSLVRTIGIDGTDENMVVTFGDGTTATIPVVTSSYSVTSSYAHTSSYFAGTIAPGTTIDGATITNTTASSLQATGSFQGNLDGTASVASKVAFALSQSDGILTFSYDGSARAAVGLDTASAVFVTAINNQISSSLTSSAQSITGSFQGDLDGTASFASKVENTLDQGLGIENFSYDGDTAGLIVQLDTSSAHYLTTIGNYTQSLSTSITASINAATSSLSASLTVTDQAISSSVAALSASASTSRNALVADISGSSTQPINNLSSSANLARRAYVSGGALLAGREEDTIRLIRGNGSEDQVTFSTASFVKSVNTVTPDAAGNVAVAITSVSTGLSSSFPATPAEGDVYIISGETADARTASNGQAWIYEDTAAQWFLISNLDQVQNDLRYVQVTGDTMTGNLVLPAANPTLANQATRKGYVDTFYNAESVDDASSEVTLTKGDGTSDIVSLAGISVSSSVSASNVGVADGRRITATTNPTENFITLNDGASNAEIGSANNLELNINTDGGAVGQIDFQNNGTSVATIDQDGTGSFAWVNATASVAQRVRHDLVDGVGVDNFAYDGNQPATVSIATYSASAATSLTNVIDGTTPIAGTVANATSASSSTTAVSASAAQNAVSASRAAIAGQVQYNLEDGVGVDNFTFNGSAPATVSINTFSASIVSNLDNVKNGVYVLQSASFAGSASGLHPGATIATTGEVTGTATNFDGSGPISISTTIADDVIDYATLGAEFTTRDTTAATALDFDSFAVFDKTLTANTTFTFTNLKIGDVKYLVLDCQGFTPTFPGTMTTVGGGTIDTTAGTDNVVSIFSPDGTNTFATILQ